MNKISQAAGVFKNPATLRKDAAKRLRAEVAAKDRSILAAGAPLVSEMCGLRRSLINPSTSRLHQALPVT
jgi:hypothetical protein